jgi:hypothetical protein
MTAKYKHVDMQLYQVYTYKVDNTGEGNELTSHVKYCYAGSTPFCTLSMP